MKNTVRIAGILIILLLSGSYLVAQRGMRGFRSDTAYMNQRRDSIRMQMAERRRSMNMDSVDWGMRHSYGMMPGMMNNRGWMRSSYQQRPGMMTYGGGMGRMQQNMPGRMIMQSMPGVTQQQKDEMAKLNENQRKEMQKLREKQQEEIKALRDEHRKKVMNILTDDQKKWLEGNAPQRRER